MTKNTQAFSFHIVMLYVKDTSRKQEEGSGKKHCHSENKVKTKKTQKGGNTK